MLKNLQRKTSSTSFIPEIDGLRFFAIVTVLIFHINTALFKELNMSATEMTESLGGKNEIFSPAWWLIRLDLGVKVFFSISGFVLALPFIMHYAGLRKNKVDLKQYFLRRITRLEPPFIISMILFGAGGYLLHNNDPRELVVNFLQGITYSFVLINGEFNPINPVTWSLETEAQFYILAPFILILLLRIKKPLIRFSIIILLLFISGLARGYFLDNNIDHLANSIIAFLGNFITGVAFCFIYVFNLKYFIHSKEAAWDILGITSILIIFYFYKPQAAISNYIIFNLGVFILFAAAFKGKYLNLFLNNRIIYTIGGMCYSIYLLHYGLAIVLIKLLPDFGCSYGWNLIISLLFLVPSITFISAIFFKLFEQPFMDSKWNKKLDHLFKKSKV
jgi:peptidoglycan/LPS O-acetylase OafA/YrhL